MRLMSITRRHDSGVTSRLSSQTVMPAALTSRLGLPSRSDTCAKAAATSSAEVTSAVVPTASGSVSALASTSSSRSTSPTRTPWRASAPAIDSPSPRAPPVTTATFPSRSSNTFPPQAVALR